MKKLTCFILACFAGALSANAQCSLTIDQISNVSCNGADNGFINITMSGTPPYTFYWQGPNAFTATTEDISGLAPGSYSLNVFDSLGCSIFFSTTISEPSAISLNTQQNNVSCKGANNGTINLLVSGGTTPYSFSWSNSATTEDITGLAPGTYTVTVTDANSCQEIISATITEPDSLLLTTAVTNASCAGVKNGSIDLSITGGTGPYTHLWSHGATTEDVTALGAGNYSVTVTDKNGCTAAISATVSEPSAMVLTTSLDSTDCGAATGSASVSVTGGVSPYSYSWNTSPVQTNDTAFNLESKTYTVEVTDDNGCVVSTSVTIPAKGGPNISFAVTDVLCKGDSTGAIDLTVTGGTTPYSFSWSNGPATEDINNLKSQNYTVTVQDNVGCTAVATAYVDEPGLITLGAIVTRPACNNDSTGSINISVSGGVAPYSYLWSNMAVTEDISGLDSGAYSVAITDANMCVFNASFNLSNPSAIRFLSVNETNVSCTGSSDGAIDISITGGTPSYTYAWSSGQSTQDATGLAAGAYTVLITDSLGCTKDTSITITEPAPLAITADSIKQVRCYGGNNGAIYITPSGGTPSYSYLWSNGATTKNLTSIAAGNYSLRLTDSRGCTDSLFFVITQPDSIMLAFTVDSADCGIDNGSATVNVSGGMSPYSYEWQVNPLQTTATAINLAALSSYSVEITDANGCFTTGTVAVPDKGGITLSTVVTDAKCYAEASGSITLTVTGGVAPFNYAWSNQDSTQNLTAVKAGTYEVTVTDVNGCMAIIRDTVNHPERITPVLTVGAVACKGESTGTLALEVSGGVPPYIYKWSNNAVTKDISGLAAGSYTVSILDSNNCKVDTTGIVDEPNNPFAASVEAVTPEACPNSNDARAEVALTDGFAPYTISSTDTAIAAATFSETLHIIDSLTRKTYLITVTDVNNCKAEASIVIPEAEDPCNDLNVPSAFSPNGDQINDTWVLRNILIHSPKYTLEVYNRWGSLVFRSDGENHKEWDGTFNGSDVPAGTYYYILNLSPGLDPRRESVTVIR